MQSAKQLAGRLGAFRRNSLYGNPGTSESRRRAGMISYQRFISDPVVALAKGFKLEKKISIPGKSALLAEFVGIVLGDGSVSDYQVRIYFNAKTDEHYCAFVRSIVFQLFSLDATIAKRPKNTLELVISSRGLVKFLLDFGLKKGNKIVNKIDIPIWVRNNTDFERAFLRGLMDTDGGIYFHTHTTKGIKYKNIGLCFTSRSKPLLSSVERIFFTMGIKVTNDLQARVSVYNKADIDKYMRLVGSHNLNKIRRFQSYEGTKA